MVECNAFISHASEDKERFVRPLARALTVLGARIWYDEFALEIGDSLLESIDRGLEHSRYGIVIFSQNFFKKSWTQYELGKLISQKSRGQTKIIPIWHGVDETYLRGVYPPLANIFALNSGGREIEWLAAQLFKRMSNLPDVSAKQTLPIADQISLVRNPYDLYEIVSSQPYTLAFINILKNEIRYSSNSSKIFSYIGGVISEVYDTNSNVAGILSALCCDDLAGWNPTKAELNKLNTICVAQISLDDFTQIPFIEPLALILDAKGIPTSNQAVVERMVNSQLWRGEDAKRLERYYPSKSVHVNEISKHWRDIERRGTSRLNDLGRLMHLLSDCEHRIRDPSVRNRLIELLKKQLRFACRIGEGKLALRVSAGIQSLKDD